MEHLDVIIVGAGISGIGAACHLKMKSPDRTYVILEGRAAIGGTWDLFRYPGIRSDSDMLTFGYSFRPWIEDRDIASAQAIRKYLKETTEEYGVDQKMRFCQRVNRVEWFSEGSKWVVDVTDLENQVTYQMSCFFLLSCTGYYDYESGYLPKFKGYDDYKGVIAHPQHWPQDLDYSGKKVLVIGSGATAVTVVPSMARDAAHVTMLQRSPTYIFSRPGEDPIAKWLRRWLPKMLAYRLTRTKNVLLSTYLYSISRRKPEKLRAFFRQMARDGVGPDIDVDIHFKPTYQPWDQRLCLIPDGDFYNVLRDGSASIVTDHIDRFTQTGVLLQSGTVINADIIVPATGLKLLFLGGINMFMDGNQIQPRDLMCYKGMMFGNIPNFTAVVGYTNSSWTLKADLTCGYVCRLLNYMKKRGYRSAFPALSEGNQQEMEQLPLIGLKSGYVERAINEMPKQSSETPWRNSDSYVLDLLAIRCKKINDGVMSFQ